jgi:hypothetical protein
MMEKMLKMCKISEGWARSPLMYLEIQKRLLPIAKKGRSNVIRTRSNNQSFSFTPLY